MGGLKGKAGTRFIWFRTSSRNMVFKHIGLDECLLGPEEPQEQGSGDGGIAEETKTRKGSRVAEDQVKEVWGGRADLRSHRTSHHIDVALLRDQDEESLRLVKVETQLEWLPRTREEESHLRLYCTTVRRGQS